MSDADTYQRLGVSLLVSAVVFLAAYGARAVFPSTGDAFLIAWGILTVGLLLMSYGGGE